MRSPAARAITSCLRGGVGRMAVGQDGLGGHTTLVGLGFSVGPVQTAREIHDCPQLAARHAFVEVDVGGKHIKAPGAPVRMFDTESRADTRGPHLGEYTDEVLKRLLGYSEEQLKALHEKGVC